VFLTKNSHELYVFVTNGLHECSNYFVFFDSADAPPVPEVSSAAVVVPSVAAVSVACFIFLFNSILFAVIRADDANARKFSYR
jgi:hypothetical protein